MKKLLLLLLAGMIIPVSLYSTTASDELKIGKKLPIWKSLLKHNDTTLIDSCENKVLIINYIDPRYKNQNEAAIYAVRNAIVDKRLSLLNFQAIGIIDCDTVWAPNSLIRSFAIEANSKLPRLKSILLFDYNGILVNKYGRKELKNNRNCILLVDKQGICRAIHADKMTKNEIVELVNMAVELQYEPFKQRAKNKEK